jgi:hypothetical protein
VAQEDLLDLGRCDGDATSHEPRRDLLCIEADDGPVNELGQHLNDQRRVNERNTTPCPLRALVTMQATVGNLDCGPFSVGADVQVLTLDGLTIDAPALD